MRKQLVIILALFAMISHSSKPVHARNIEPIIQSEKRAAYQLLTAAANSELILDRVEAYEDGQQQAVRAQHTRSAGDPVQSYLINVDLQTNTYTAKLVSPREHSTLSRNLSTPYLAIVTATTFDPVNIPCNSTTLEWGWSEQNNNGSSFHYRSRSLRHWDAQPTPIGTYWNFVQSNYLNEPDGTHQSATSMHENDDFLGGFAGTTTVNYQINLTSIVHGKYHYDVEQITKGPAGALLHLGIESK